MPRADYDRFCKLVSDGLLPGCILHNTHNTPGFAPLFSKICVEGTRFETEETRAAGYKQGIFIDVFPYDETFKELVAVSTGRYGSEAFLPVSFV